jgi:hypothetical protein
MTTLTEIRKELLEVINLLDTVKNEEQRSELLKQESKLVTKYNELKNK